jgi:hypothetical protein
VGPSQEPVTLNAGVIERTLAAYSVIILRVGAMKQDGTSSPRGSVMSRRTRTGMLARRPMQAHA